MAEIIRKEDSKISKKKPEKFAVVRVRGIIGITHDIKRTLEQLRLHKKNYCVVLPNDESFKGMIMKVKDYVTWGNIEDDTYKLLIEKKGEPYLGREQDSKGKITYSSKFVDVNGKKLKKFFRLNSPIKGYGKAGIKMPFNKGGSLGYRAEKINDLIKRMI